MIAILVLIPLTCCVSPFVFLVVTAPTKWKYDFSYEYPPETDSDDRIRGIGVSEHNTGPLDYANNSYVPIGQRDIQVLIRREPDDSDVRVLLLEFELRSSLRGVIKTHLDAELPYEFKFDIQYTSSHYGEWTSSQFVETDLPSGEVLTSRIVIEIIRNGESSSHEIRKTSTPNSRKLSWLHWLPSR